MDKNLNKYISEKKKEKYITDEKICELILNYIKKENTEYAILIDGKWGVGKTFFVKNTLETKLQKEIKKFGRYKGIIYISLCGIRYINQLENKIIYSIIENSILSKSRISKILIDETKTYINSLEKREFIMGTIKMFQAISQYIIFFDDLERCMISITELLGYINELVEHKNVKTVLIANEDKMREFEGSYKNELYYEIKEKLIGEVIYYNPNIEIILDCICNEEEEYLVSKIIKNNKYKIIEIMQKFNYKNIRALKNCIFKFKTIIEEMEKIKNTYKDYNENIYNELLNNILIYLLHVTIMYKENINLYNWGNLLSSFGIIDLMIGDNKIEILGFKFVDNLVQYSIMDLEDMENVLRIYNKKKQSDIYGKGRAFDVITNFAGKKDNEVEEALKEMKNEIKNDMYMIDIYSKILCYLLEIRYAEYDEKIIDDIINLMEYNIKNNKNNCITEFIPCILEDCIEKEKYYEILKKWKKYDRERVLKNREEKTKEIFRKEDWGEKFKEYCKHSKYEFERNRSFFSSINVKELLNNIRYSDSKNILEFIRGINTVYNFKYISKNQKKLKNYYKEDINNILKIKQEIEKIKNTNMEKGKKYLINKLIEILENWINDLKCNGDIKIKIQI